MVAICPAPNKAEPECPQSVPPSDKEYLFVPIDERQFNETAANCFATVRSGMVVYDILQKVEPKSCRTVQRLHDNKLAAIEACRPIVRAASFEYARKNPDIMMTILGVRFQIQAMKRELEDAVGDFPKCFPRHEKKEEHVPLLLFLQKDLIKI